MARQSFPSISINQQDKSTWLRQLSIAINNLLNGKVNSVDDVTLTTNSATTVVSDEKVGENSFIGITPSDSISAADIFNTYISSVGNGTFTITHSNLPDTRSLRYVILG